jgi:hypothetical protein
MGDATAQTVYFCDRHPISLSKLRASRGHLDGLRPDDLFPYDQDHYGGLAATDELARGLRSQTDREWQVLRRTWVPFGISPTNMAPKLRELN